MLRVWLQPLEPAVACIQASVNHVVVQRLILERSSKMAHVPWVVLVHANIDVYRLFTKMG